MISKGKLRHLKKLMRVNHKGHFYFNGTVEVKDVSHGVFSDKLPMLTLFCEKGPTDPPEQTLVTRGYQEGRHKDDIDLDCFTILPAGRGNLTIVRDKERAVTAAAHKLTIFNDTGPIQ